MQLTTRSSWKLEQIRPGEIWSRGTLASAIQNDFFKTPFMCKKNISTQWQKSVTKDYNYLLIVMNSVFDYSLSGLLVSHKSKHFLRGKQDF